MDEIIQFQGKDYLCRYIDTEHGLFLIAEDDLESKNTHGLYTPSEISGKQRLIWIWR